MTAAEGFAGEFWLGSEPGRRVKGALHLTNGIRLELEDSLTSMWLFQEVVDESGRSYQSGGPRKNSEMPPPFVVLGNLTGSDLHEVALHECTPAGWSPNLHSPGTNEPQVLRAMYCLAGGHGPGEAGFTGLELEVRHLRHWLEHEWADSATLANGARLTLKLKDDEPPCIRIEGLPQSRFRDIERYFIFTISQLLTLCLVVHCPPVSARLYSEPEGKWLDLFIDYIAPRQDFPWAMQPFTLAHADDVGAEGVAGWLDKCQKLVPLPSVIAATVETGAEPIPLDSSLLQLTTAAEGLFIRLCDDPSQPMTRSTARELRILVSQALRDAGIADRDIQAVDKKLELLRQRTFRDGLRKLVESYGGALANALGRIEPWISYVHDYRNEFAHWKEESRGIHADNFSSYEAIAHSLRWLLVAVLLQEAGIDSETLRQRLASRPDYRDFIERAPGLLPEVYAGQGET